MYAATPAMHLDQPVAGLLPHSRHNPPLVHATWRPEPHNIRLVHRSGHVLGQDVEFVTLTGWLGGGQLKLGIMRGDSALRTRNLD